MQIAHLLTVLDRAAASTESLDSEIQVEKVWTCFGGSLYDEVQFIMDDGHMGSPCEHTHTHTHTHTRDWRQLPTVSLENVSW